LKEETVRTGWTNVLSWLYTAVVAVAYVTAYVVMAFGVTALDAKLGNVLLALWAAFGVVVLYYVVEIRIYRHHRDGNPRVLQRVLWFGATLLVLLVIWHVAFAYTAAAQFGAHAPATLLLVALIAIVIRPSNLKEH
jgi:hypothetical protein